MKRPTMDWRILWSEGEIYGTTLCDGMGLRRWCKKGMVTSTRTLDCQKLSLVILDSSIEVPTAVHLLSRLCAISTLSKLQLCHR